VQLTIQKLRKAGFKVRVLHERHYEVPPTRMSRMDQSRRLSAKGGYTRIEVSTPNKEITVVGEAYCSLKDSFNRKLGNSVALGRALAKLEKDQLGAIMIGVF
jgi:hypothetical protein